MDDDGDGFTQIGGDCDDTNPQIHPEATEICDGADNDCDGEVDGPTSEDATPFYADADGDGFGDPDAEVRACAAPAAHVDTAGDCNDDDPRFHPLADEACDDDEDLNCDGSIGAVDVDEDGFVACMECNDADRESYPGAEERCDGRDNDCDGEIDVDAVDATPWWPDLDGDGFGDADAAPEVRCDPPPDAVDNAGDCDDADGTVHPDAASRFRRTGSTTTATGW